MTKKQTTFQHVHLGAGAFGLGFVVPLVRLAGFETILANRARGSVVHHDRNVTIQQQGGYNLVLVGKIRRTEPVVISDFVFLDENRERFFAIVADPKTRLITTALRQGLLPSVPILADALAHRLENDTKETIHVVACETPTIGDSLTLRSAILAHHPELMTREFDQRISFVPCIVDRICNEPRLEKATGQVSVEAEEFAEWLLQGHSSLENILVTVSTQQLISFVGNLAPFARRKTWLVNGPHLLIALRAFMQNRQFLDRFLSEKENAQLLTDILHEAREAFLEVEPFFSLNDLTHYTRRIHARFSSFPDRTMRHLPRLAKHRIHEFMTDFFKKCGAIQLPYGIKNKRVAYQTAITLLITSDLIAHGRYAYDEAGQPTPVD